MLTLFSDKNDTLTKHEMDDNFRHLSGGVIQVVSYLSTIKAIQTLHEADSLIHDLSKEITPKGDNSSFLISIRWFGECVNPWDTVFNITADGQRINNNNDYSGLASPQNGFHVVNDESTPETCNFSTFFKSNCTKNIPILFEAVARRKIGNATTICTNSTFLSNQDYTEKGTSEIIIMEIGEQV